ncbi:MAG TPA: response regulator [Anaerolineae bacterium]|nr:response regulator [Anaerolineae bacterium]HQI85826.1 response regulator [Anaerolineae bacterium]
MSKPHGTRVLIVEDEPLIVEMLTGMLEELAYSIAGVAINGKEAVELTQTLRPDVILMDIGMSEMDGIEAARQIQKLCPTPVIVLTAYDGRDLLEKAAGAGVDAYLLKPTTPRDLENAITTVLARFKDMLELRRLNVQLQAEVVVRQQVEEDRSRLLTAEREQRLLAEMLTEVTLSLTSQTNYAMVLDEILTQARRIVPFKSASILRLEGDVLRTVRWQGYGEHDAFMAKFVLPLKDFPILAETVQSQKPYIISNVFQEPRWVLLEEIVWIKSALFIPICSRQRVLGTLNLDSSRFNAFSSADTERLAPLVSAAAIAIENVQLREGLEAEVAARTAEIAAERDKSEVILRNAGDAIAMLDNAMRIQYVNPAFERLTGYTAAETLGKNVHHVLKSEMSEKSIQAMQLTYHTAVEWRNEIVIYRRDGRVYDAMATITPIQGAAGDVTGYVFSHQDISALKALDRARSQFITGISHELRTPLTVLDLAVRKLQRRIPADADLTALDTMALQIAQLTHFTEDILEIAALDSGKGAPLWEPLMLVPLVTDTVRRYQERAEAAGLTLHCLPIAPNLPVVHGDHSRIARMLSEIVENAIIYTPSGGHIEVAMRAVDSEGHTWLTIAVRDNGPGMPPEEQERLFERFFRGHLAEPGHILGSGLGLSIAQGIARAHGGRITVDSAVGEGSTFTIWLPTAS